MAVRTMMVKNMMLSPKLLKNSQYSSTKLLIMGLMIPSFQMVPIISTACASLPANRWAADRTAPGRPRR